MNFVRKSFGGLRYDEFTSRRKRERAHSESLPGGINCFRRSFVAFWKNIKNLNSALHHTASDLDAVVIPLYNIYREHAPAHAGFLKGIFPSISTRSTMIFSWKYLESASTTRAFYGFYENCSRHDSYRIGNSI